MIYVHIGLPKAGSTSIQQFLSKNPELLSRYQIVYPEEGRRSGGHHKVYHAMQARSKDSVLKDLRTRFLRDNNIGYVISAEGLSKATDEDIDVLAKRVIRDIPIQVVIYVRDLRDWICSVYNQNAKRFTVTVDFDEYFTSTMKRGRIELSVVARRWANQFGAMNVRVRTLSSEDLAGGSLLTDLCECIHLPVAAIEEADPSSVKRRNEGTWWEVAEYIRAIASRIEPIVAEASEETIVEWGSINGFRARRGKAIKSTKSAAKPRVSGVAEACVAGLEAAGLSSQAIQYLTPEQSEALRTRYVEELDLIRSAIPNARVTAPASTGDLAPRPFLPSIETIPPEYVQAMNEGVRAHLPLERMPTPIREILEMGC